jgi:hypothetical protein
MAGSPAAERRGASASRGVVAGDAVDVHGRAGGATVHERPLAVVSGRDADRLHRCGTVRRAVAGEVVTDVQAPKTIRAVIAMFGARSHDRDVEATAAAAEAFRFMVAGMGTAMGCALVARQAGTSESKETGTRAARAPREHAPGALALEAVRDVISRGGNRHESLTCPSDLGGSGSRRTSWGFGPARPRTSTQSQTLAVARRCS